MRDRQVEARTPDAGWWRRFSRGVECGSWPPCSSPTPTPTISAVCPRCCGRSRPGLVVEPATFYPDPLYLGFLRLLAEERIAWHPGRAGECFRLDGVSFTILHPGAHWTRWGEDINEDSLVLLVEYGDFQALFAGDAGFPAEEALRSQLGPVDLLKVGHHGSRGSTGADWLERLRPAVAVISVGRNEYGHPAPATLARLGAGGSRRCGGPTGRDSLRARPTGAR